MRWSTRTGPHVDRTACAWLIRHFDGECTFETIQRRHQLDDPVLWSIARIVHQADQEVLDLSDLLYDGLYEYLKRSAVTGRDPA